MVVVVAVGGLGVGTEVGGDGVVGLDALKVDHGVLVDDAVLCIGGSFVEFGESEFGFESNFGKFFQNSVANPDSNEINLTNDESVVPGPTCGGLRRALRCRCRRR